MKHDDKKGREPRQLRELVETFGTNHERWPETERDRAKLEVDSNEPGWLSDERRLDAWLDSAEHIAPSAALLRKVAEIPARNERPVAGWFGWRGVRNALALGTLAAALGLAVGVATPEATTMDDVAADDEFSMLALGGVDLNDGVDLDEVDVSEEILP